MAIGIARQARQAAVESQCGSCDGSGIRHAGGSSDIGVAILLCSACGALHSTWHRWLTVACWSVSVPILLLGMLLF